MKRSKHLQHRMSQRGITKGMIDLVCHFGKQDGDHIVMDKNCSKELMKSLRTVMKIIDKGGIVVVNQGDTLITTYNR